MPVASDKRERLVEAAREVLHDRGYAAATLADIAARAEVPAGNVYYWFRTKDALAEAVVDVRLSELQALLAGAEQRDDPRERVAAFLEARGADAEAIARSGCPFAGLVRDLGDREPPLGPRARRLVGLQLAWLSGQLERLGDPGRAAERAAALLAGVQGACVLAHALGDATVLRARLAALAEDAHGGSLPRRAPTA